MKTKSFKKFLGAVGVTSAIAILTFVGCTKEKIVTDTVTNTVIDSVFVNANLSDSKNDGAEKIDARIGGFPPSSYATTDSGAWKVDKAHCNVMWETKYYVSGAMLTGRFNMFNMMVNFDEANPANTTIKAWVQLSTFNTGEPGRDAYGTRNQTTGKFVNGCGQGYMGLAFDSALSGSTFIEVPQPAKDSAFFVSTGCVKSGNIYLVTGNFTFRNVTKVVEMKMGYYPRTTTNNVSGGKTYHTDRAGLYGEFTINANTDFAVNSTSINDAVKIRVDVNMVTNKYTGTNIH